MVTCFIKYIIDPKQLEVFERYGKTWIDLVNALGGIHHGYLLPHEGANNIAYASFSFSSLATYEVYRNKILEDEGCQEALKLAEDSNCIISYERSFMKPVFKGFKS